MDVRSMGAAWGVLTRPTSGPKIARNQERDAEQTARLEGVAGMWSASGSTKTRMRVAVKRISKMAKRATAQGALVGLCRAVNLR